MPLRLQQTLDGVWGHGTCTEGIPWRTHINAAYAPFGPLLMCQPLLLIDIDGVISLFGFDPQRRPPGRFVTVDGIIHLLSDAAAGHLLGLTSAFDLVWCSGWEDKADEYLPHAVGLPAGLPHLVFGPPVHPKGRHWKLAAIDRFAGAARPMAWIDDGHDETCRRWAVQRPGPTVLVTTDPAVGLTEHQAAELGDWALELGRRRRGDRRPSLPPSR